MLWVSPNLYSYIASGCSFWSNAKFLLPLQLKKALDPKIEGFCVL